MNGGITYIFWTDGFAKVVQTPVLVRHCILGHLTIRSASPYECKRARRTFDESVMSYKYELVSRYTHSPKPRERSKHEYLTVSNDELAVDSIWALAPS